MIPYGHQLIGEDDIDAVVQVLRSDFLTQGPAVPRFEEALARYCGAPHAVATCNATAALHLACLALGLGPGDRLWTSPITFVASANCGRYCGAEVDFVDIDPNTWTLCPQALERKLVEAERDGRLPKIVVAVHLCGHSCDLRAIHALSARYGFRIIEDASHAIGARYLGEPVGCCRYSDITVFSFHPVKIITTGEGGMALTRDAALAERMARLRSHGITRDPARMSGPPDGPWYYEQTELGFNYRMTELQAALGTSQLKHLDAWVAQRNALAHRYAAALDGLPLTIQQVAPDCRSAYHLFVIRLLQGCGARPRREVFEALRASGIGVNVHYIPLYHQPGYRNPGAAGRCPEAERYYAGAITLPLFPALGEADQDHVVQALRGSLQPPGTSS